MEGVRWYAPEAVGAVEAVMAGGGFAVAPVAALNRVRDLLAVREEAERRRSDRPLGGDDG